ncbi:alpha/beta hydrolase [soil metagenome]
MFTTKQFEIAGLPVLKLIPEHASKTSPVIVWLHDGQFSSGDPIDALPLASLLAEDAVVLVPDYPLAPAHPFPAALNAVFELLKEVAAAKPNAAALMIGGDRAGGNLAAALSLRARDEGLKRLSAQILLRPMLDAAQTTASMRAAGNCPCAQAWRDYLSKPSDAMHPYAAPLTATRLAGLVPALIVTGESEPTRDEGEQYAARLLVSGVPTQVLRMKGSSAPMDSSAQSTTGQPVIEVLRSFVSCVALSCAPRKPVKTI